MTKLQSWTIAGLGTVALVAGVILASMAVSSAQESTPAPTASGQSSGEATPTPVPGGETQPGRCGPGGFGGRGNFMNIDEAAAAVLGLSEDDLHAALIDGQTLAGVAQAHGMSTDDLKSALKDNVTTELQAELDAGDITQDQYDSITADLDAKLDGFINRSLERGPHFGGGGHFRGGGQVHFMDIDEAAAAILGLSEDDLRSALMGGQTLAEIAADHGMSVNDLKSALTDKITADLQAELDAGDITQEQFDAATTGLSEQLDTMINSENGMPFGGPHPGHGGGPMFPGFRSDGGTGPSTDSAAPGSGA